jgi:hypothetical protein
MQASLQPSPTFFKRLPTLGKRTEKTLPISSASPSHQLRCSHPVCQGGLQGSVRSGPLLHARLLSRPPANTSALKLFSQLLSERREKVKPTKAAMEPHCPEHPSATFLTYSRRHSRPYPWTRKRRHCFALILQSPSKRQSTKPSPLTA